MRVTRTLFNVGIVVVAVALMMFGWLYLPLPPQRVSQTFAPEQLTPGSGQNLAEAWTLDLEAPRRIPLGRAGTIHLTFSAVQIAAEPGTGTDTFESYSVRAEARAEIPSAGSSPSGLSSEALGPGNRAQFTWQVRPQSTGSLDGRVWLYLRFVPKGGGDVVERPLNVQSVTIRVVTLFGRDAGQVSQTGLIAFGIGFVLLLPHVMVLSRRSQMRANL